MREGGFHSPSTGYFRDRLIDAAYFEAPAFLKYYQPQWGPPIFADDAATQPRTDTLGRPAWLWTPFRWDPDELRVTTRPAGLRQAPRRLTRRSRPALAGVFRPVGPLLGRPSRRRVLAATLLAILFALGVHLSASGAEPAPISVSTSSTEGADQPAATAKCDASTGRLLYVTALDACVPAEW